VELVKTQSALTKKTSIRHRAVALYRIRPRNGSGLFFQHRSQPHEATRLRREMDIAVCLSVSLSVCIRTPVSDSGPLFTITLAKVDRFSFFTVKFGKGLWRKLIKITSIKSVAALPCEREAFSYTALHSCQRE